MNKEIAKAWMNLGILTRLVRQKIPLKRKETSALSGISKDAIAHLEHGRGWEVKSDIIQLINFYKMPEDKEKAALQLLDICFSESDPNISVTLPSDVVAVILKKTKPAAEHWPRPRRPHYKHLPRKVHSSVIRR